MNMFDLIRNHNYTKIKQAPMSLLSKTGTDPEIKFNDNKIARDYALESNNMELINFLIP